MCLSGLEINICREVLSKVVMLLTFMKRNCPSKLKKVKKRLVLMAGPTYLEIISVIEVEIPDFVKKLRVSRRTLDDFGYLKTSSVASFSDLFRFRSVAQVKRLVRGFRLLLVEENKLLLTTEEYYEFSLKKMVQQQLLS